MNASRHHSNRARGQSLLEFAIVMPLILMLVFGAFALIARSQKALVYTKESQTLVEWVARTGVYDATKGAAIKADLSANPFVGSSDAYLHIVVSTPAHKGDAIGLPDATVREFGQAPGTGPLVPSATWDGTIGNIPTGSAVAVEIWSYYNVTIPYLTTLISVPAGHAVFYALHQPTPTPTPTEH
jgi:hypothetical protein